LPGLKTARRRTRPRDRRRAHERASADASRLAGTSKTEHADRHDAGGVEDRSRNLHRLQPSACSLVSRRPLTPGCPDCTLTLRIATVGFGNPQVSDPRSGNRGEGSRHARLSERLAPGSLLI
jgi:hypothetical protein